MSESKHTPGPWVHSASMIYAPGENGGNICELSELRKSRHVQHDKLELGSKDWDEQMANGKLIAAAPELLRACEAIRASGGLEGANLSNAIDMCRAAIAKAKGES